MIDVETIFDSDREEYEFMQDKKDQPMKEQIEENACKNCIHYQMCVDTFRKAKQDGEILLIEEEAYFANANGCDFYADKRIYRKQSEGEWEKRTFIIFDSEKVCYHCSECNTTWDTETNFCPNCGARMSGGKNE